MQFGKVANHESFSREKRIFQKILSKLMLNTPKFVSTGIVSDVGLDNREVRIRVKHNGIGVDDFHRQQVFRVFKSLCKGSLIWVELPESPEIK